MATLRRCEPTVLHTWDRDTIKIMLLCASINNESQLGIPKSQLNKYHKGARYKGARNVWVLPVSFESKYAGSGWRSEFCILFAVIFRQSSFLFVFLSFFWYTWYQMDIKPKIHIGSLSVSILLVDLRIQGPNFVSTLFRPWRFQK